jgi:hypothetical protein
MYVKREFLHFEIPRLNRIVSACALRFGRNGSLLMVLGYVLILDSTISGMFLFASMLGFVKLWR